MNIENNLSINRGEIVLFNNPFDSSYATPAILLDIFSSNIIKLSKLTDKHKKNIKRIIGLPGEQLKYQNDMIYINDNPIKYENHLNEKATINSGEEERYLYKKEYLSETYNLVRINSQTYKNNISFDLYIPKKGDILEIIKNENSVENTKPADEFYNLIDKNSNIKISINSFQVSPEQYIFYKALIYYENIEQLKNEINTSDILNLNNIYDVEGIIDSYLEKYFLNNSNLKISLNKSYYFLMGDNRDNTNDSRNIGFIGHNMLCGKASFIIFPIQNIGFLK